MQWHAIQVTLEQAESDAVILLDCRAAASPTPNPGNGVTEIIAACGFEASTSGVGEHSFTRSLTDKLKYLSRSAPFTIALLHNKVLTRMKYWKPYEQPEQRRTPLYICQANEKRQRSILIEPMRLQTQSTSESLATSTPSPLSQPSVPTPPVDPHRDVDMLSTEPSQSSFADVWPDPHFKHPKVIITVALENDQWLDTENMTEWLRKVPALANWVQFEGVFQSDSTLIILSLPVAMWNLMPNDPAVSFIGFVRSRNTVMIDESEHFKSKGKSKDDPSKIVAPL